MYPASTFHSVVTTFGFRGFDLSLPAPFSSCVCIAENIGNKRGGRPEEDGCKSNRMPLAFEIQGPGKSRGYVWLSESSLVEELELSRNVRDASLSFPLGPQ